MNSYLLISLVLVVAHIGEAAINYQLYQPQIYVDDGHIYMIPAKDRNLILLTNGTGKILFDELELNALVASVANSTRDLQSFKRIFGVPTNSSAGFSNRIAHLEQSVNRLNQLDSLDARLLSVERQIAYPNSSTTQEGTVPSGPPSAEVTPSQVPRGGLSQRLVQLRRRVRTLETRVRNLGSASRNPCSSNPCSNGGSCIPTIFGPFCQCSKGWEGDRCELDINECTAFYGTDLGCQNGGICNNLPGSYLCNCRSGYTGIHCAQRGGDCSSGPSWELCGHGICVNQQTGSRPFICICEQGWKTDGTNPACSVDVDECTGPHSSCSRNPPVACINTPGGFHCGSCPNGYTGNGYQCTDINECLQNNGGCSMNPYVQCLNTVGSRTCGECPPGYIGNGESCTYIGVCQINNGGCHPLARCVGNPAIGQSFVQCMCPAGYTGTGMGLHGCFPYGGGGGGGGGGDTGIIPASNPCASNPCLQGSCTSYGNTFNCICFPGFTGPTCAVRVEPCSSSPCQNGGTCQSSSTGFTCLCPNDFTGLRCETQQESCGGDMYTPEGMLKFPHDSSVTYNHNTNCMWKIGTTFGKVLNITFTNFHLEGGGSACNFDWLQIFDGRDTSAPSMGKFCGNELPRGGNFFSTHEILTLWFRSDHSLTGLGFELNWNTTDSICGEAIEGQTHGSINSPGYPGNYPHNRDCMWSISVNPTKRIQLVFATLQLEIHPNCSFDYLEVRDGLEESAPVLAKYCNTTLPPPIVSSGPYLTLRFHTDESSADKGFHVTFAEVPGIPGCGGIFTEGQGAFSSPSHPEPYPHGMDCEYIIRLPSVDERIVLTFVSFELESGYNCRFDHVEIRDGNGRDSRLIGRFCESNTPPVIRSSTNTLHVRFRTDSSIAYGGFRAQYRAICGGIFGTPEGILRSPYYPAAYPKNRDCVYIISQPVGRAITLEFQDFDIEGTNDVRCYFDYLEIRDGDDANSTLVGHYCGGPQSMPEPVISTLNYLFLRFRTDGSIQNRGFLANYSTFDISCGGILRESNGIISSPGHPEVYPHGIRCKWIIRGVPGQVIRLNWVSFSLERNAVCRYDAVEIYDNSTFFANGSGLIGRYCGNELPPVITSSDYTLTINFISDHSVAHDGFMAHYVLSNATTVCDGNYFTSNGVIRSPNYPRNYPNGKACTWTIRVANGQQIMLNITEFDLENGTSQGCIYDYLEIRNGGYMTSPLIGKFCGNNLPPRSIPSFSNALYMKFSTDVSQTRKGFLIFWDGSTQGCGGRLDGPYGSIVSPNYPMSSASRTECFWTITVNQGSSIQFTFVDLDLQRSAVCWGEYVEVQDGSRADSRVIGKYCRADSVLAINSTGNSLRIKFVSQYGSVGRGFHASYQSICSREITGHSGVIESPNFPLPYPHHRSCNWTIKAPLGNMLNLSFSHFSLERSHGNSCVYDFVEVLEYDRTTETPTSLQRICGDTSPAMISSTKNHVIVRFESDATVAMNGFRLEWVVHGCGGPIYGNWGVLKSPNYPNPYPKHVECEWVIIMDIGTKVLLTIYELDMEISDGCVFDYLRIYGGGDPTSPLLTQLCQKTERSQTVTSHGNSMLVRFGSDGSVGGKGFYGYAYSVPGGCGGQITAPQGFIYSPNYPANYDSNDDCGWLITVDDSHVVELNFLEFNIERHINCSYDHVAVYDGSSIYSPQLLMACGNDIPDSVKSTGNQMFIRLRTDDSATGKGFKANYTTGCGARLTQETSGVITSPGFPHFIYRMNCTWFIMGPEPDDRVTLTFTHLDIQSRATSQENCSSNYVEVLDGEDLDAPSVGKYCLSRIPPSLTSQGNGFVIRILTESAYGFGFRVIYDVSVAACGGTLTSAEGSFTTPNYPNGYPPNAECVWRLQASAGNRVSISFRRIDIETSEYCNTDFVEIHERDETGRLLGHFCGNEIPANLTASESLWILFRSDADGQAPGFFVDYSLVHGNELNGSSGVLESPLFPMPYNLIGTFSWRITVNFTQSIQIYFDTFDFGFDYPGQGCPNFLKIYDGYDETATELMSKCDQAIPETFTSTGNVIYVSFVKVVPAVQSIFRFYWQEVPTSEQDRTQLSTNITGCGGNITILDGSNITTLLSPGFTENGYPPSARCEWIINTINLQRIKIKVEEMLLEGHPTCLYDKVEVYDGVNGLPNYELNRTLCSRSDVGTILISSGRTVKIIFLSDSSYNRQGFNLSLSTECGGVIRDTRGRITSPNYPLNYGNSNCSWSINVRPGRTIGITFEAPFDIYRGSQTDCSTDQLILRNGGHSDSPLLGQGRYCGSAIPTVPETSGNQLSAQFTAWTAGGRGFAMVFSEVSAGCGGQFHLSNDAPGLIINSPNYPIIPPPFTECEWVVTVPQNEVVQLEFQLSFQLDTSSYWCENEGVDIRDGGTQLARRIGLFCQNMPGTQKSTGNIMYVRYYTNLNEPRNGFKAKISIATCGGLMVGWGGVITSPGYPTSYDINLDCEWTIRGSEGSFLMLSFEDLELSVGNDSPDGNSGNCTNDWILITEVGIDEVESPRNWTFCDFTNASLPRRIETSMNQVRVIFHSDSTRETRKGFRLRYWTSSEECGGTLTAPTGIVQTPGYPRAYPHYRSCYWRILAPAGRRIRLEFLDFDMEERIIRPDGTQSCNDRVYISQSTHHSRMYNVTNLCGTTLPSPMESTTNKMGIYFQTDGSVSHRGFKASYTTDLPSICGGDLTGDYGVVASPSEWTATANVTSYFTCEYQHTGDASNGTTIITLNSVRIPPWETSTNSCTNGIVLITPTLSGYSSPFVYKGYCKSANEKLYLPGSSFDIAYFAGHRESSFNLTYQVAYCGFVSAGPNDTIISPNFPTNYQTNIECIWTLEYPGGSQVRLSFTDMDLDGHIGDDQKCDKDFVVVRNGKYPSSPILGTYCGTNTPPDIITMSPFVWIEFHSDGEGNGNRRGFRMVANIIEQGCGGTIHQKNGRLRSPKIARPTTGTPTSTQYPPNSECEWIIETIPGYVVNIVFYGRFDIETTVNCTNDFVEIFGQQSNSWKSIGRYCGKELPPSINTTSTSVKVLFRSNQAINGDGFQLVWYSPCGGLFREETGIIRSAYFDRHAHWYQSDPGNFESYYYWESIYRVYSCNYVIQGNSSNDYIVTEFLPPFEVTYAEPRNPDVMNSVCPYVNVSISEGITPTSYWRRRGEGPFCGQELPRSYIGRGLVTINYNYLPDLHNYGFRVRYSIYQCGGNISEPRSLQSPGHPFPYASNMNCTWVVTAPVGKVVRFKIEKLEMEYSRNCNWDAIKLFDGERVDQVRKLGTFCGNLTETLGRISSKSNVMTVQFITDSSVTHSGFLGSLDFTVGEQHGCGGNVNLTTQTQNIQSPDSNMDGKYDGYLECNWMVVGADFQIVELTFNTFVLEGRNRAGPSRLNTTEDCPYDYVEIRDGPGPFGEVLGKFCGTSIPPRIISSVNFMWITFVSDGSYEFSGFTATLSSRPSPCGATFVLNATSAVQVLTSPNFPQNYPANLRCKWTVDGARFQDEVDIRFIELDIETSPDCNKDRLEIRDIATSYTSPEGIGGPILFNGNRPVDWRFRSLGIDVASIMQNFRYCGSQTPSDFFSIGRSAEITFITDSDTAARGFQLEYKAAGCNRTFENSQGRIFSPEWPAHSPMFANCIIRIQAQNGSFVSMFFNQFQLWDSEGCSETYFEVRENNQGGQLLARYCGSSRPNPIFANTSVLWINFFTRLRMSRGFDISYTTTSAGVGCGGDLFHTGGSVASPMYPGNFSQVSDCRWRLRVPAGLKIQLEFTSFMIGGDCSNDFVELFSLNSHQLTVDPLLFTRYCSGDSPSVYSGDTDMIMLRYKTSVNNTGIGWRAEFRGIANSAIPT